MCCHLYLTANVKDSLIDQKDESFFLFFCSLQLTLVPPPPPWLLFFPSPCCFLYPPFLSPHSSLLFLFLLFQFHLVSFQLLYSDLLFSKIPDKKVTEKKKKIKSSQQSGCSVNDLTGRCATFILRIFLGQIQAALLFLLR